MSIEDVLKLLALIIVVGSQIKAFFDGSNDRKARKESDDLLSGRLTVLRTDVDLLTRTKRELEAQVEALKDTEEKQDKTIKDLRSEFDRSQGVILALEGEKNRLVNDNRTLGERIAVESQNRNLIYGELDKLRGEHIELRRKYDELLVHVQNQESEVSRLQKDNNVLLLYLVYMKYSPLQIEAVKLGKYEVFHEWKNSYFSDSVAVQEPEGANRSDLLSGVNSGTIPSKPDTGSS